MLAKACSNCRKLYSDTSLNYCLQDGKQLSDSYDFPEFLLDQSEVVTEFITQPAEAKTVEKEKASNSVEEKRKMELEEWRYEKKERTKSVHPISVSPTVSDRPLSKWTASDYVRQITFEITGQHTFHAKENMELLRSFLNRLVADTDRQFKKSTMQLGVGRLESFEGVFAYDFQKSADPTATGFLISLIKFLSS